MLFFCRFPLKSRFLKNLDTKKQVVFDTTTGQRREKHMKVTDFNFELPQELIAQDPLEDRASSRLLVLDKETGEIKHRHFRDILRFLHKGDCLVINDTKVIPARLMGHKEDTGAAIEVLLLKRKSDTVWETLVKPGKKMNGSCSCGLPWQTGAPACHQKASGKNCPWKRHGAAWKY